MIGPPWARFLPKSAPEKTAVFDRVGRPIRASLSTLLSQGAAAPSCRSNKDDQK
jgi:hypothetical protein